MDHERWSDSYKPPEPEAKIDWPFVVAVSLAAAFLLAALSLPQERTDAFFAWLTDCWNGVKHLR